MSASPGKACRLGGVGEPLMFVIALTPATSGAA